MFAVRFALVPASTLGMLYFWNLLTGALFHSYYHLFDAILSSLVVLLSGSPLVSLWESNELFKFMILSCLASGFGTYFFEIGQYLLTPYNPNTDHIFLGYGGSYGLVLALLIALKQNFPDTQLGSGPVSIKNLPFLYLVLCGVLSLVHGDASICVFAVSGGLWSWVYLRFFQNKNGTIGDLSNDFTFASLFPEFLQGSVRVITRPLSLLCCGTSKRDTSSYTLPVSAPQSTEADRRRQVGLKALDERIAKIKNTLPRETLVVTTDIL